MAATIPNVVGDGFAKDQGDTVERPKPDPKVKRMIEIPTAASAPPTIAAHSTAAPELSTDCSGTRTASLFDATDMLAPSARIERGE
jgi:hypothetical protein